MTIETIKCTLMERFAADLPDYYERRVIFWYDSEREFEGLLDELHLDGVKLLRLTGDNYFEAKMLLSETDIGSNYLVYDPVSHARRDEDQLRDIELYSEEFRADLVSMQMDELHIPQTTLLRRARYKLRKRRTAAYRHYVGAFGRKAQHRPWRSASVTLRFSAERGKQRPRTHSEIRQYAGAPRNDREIHW